MWADFPYESGVQLKIASMKPRSGFTAFEIVGLFIALGVIV